MASTGTLYTLGYAALGSRERLDTLMGDDLTASPIATLLADIRYSPRSRAFPEWSKVELEKRYRHCYRALGWSLGNVNYQTNGPILLANPEPGIRDICWHLWRGTNVILLCVCRDEATCHRALVAKMVREALEAVS